MLVLPFISAALLAHEPMVAGAWMGLAVKTDGAAVAAGGISESLILAKNAAEGVRYQPGWVLGTATTIKVFIDIFIGIWSFVLGYIWTNYINVTADSNKAKAREIWQRFPKFIIGFVVTFTIGLYLALGTPTEIAKKVPAAIGEANAFRVIFFILTFFSIGVLSDFKSLWQEGFGRLAAVYVVSLFGFVSGSAWQFRGSSSTASRRRSRNDEMPERTSMARSGMTLLPPPPPRPQTAPVDASGTIKRSSQCPSSARKSCARNCAPQAPNRCCRSRRN